MRTLLCELCDHFGDVDWLARVVELDAFCQVDGVLYVAELQLGGGGGDCTLEACCFRFGFCFRGAFDGFGGLLRR